MSTTFFNDEPTLKTYLKANGGVLFPKQNFHQLLDPLDELDDEVNGERRQLDSNGFLLTEICFRLSVTTKLLNINWNLMTYERQLCETFSTFIPPSLTSLPTAYLPPSGNNMKLRRLFSVWKLITVNLNGAKLNHDN